MNAEVILPPVPEPKTNRLAVASLVLGIMSLVFCFIGIVFAVPGLICGIMGMKRVKNSSGTEKGRNLALVGTICSGTILIGSLVMVRATKPKRASMGYACVANLKTINGAKATWAMENQKEQTDKPMDAELFGIDKYLREKPTCPDGGIYTINPVGSKPTCTVRGHTF